MPKKNKSNNIENYSLNFTFWQWKAFKSATGSTLSINSFLLVTYRRYSPKDGTSLSNDLIRLAKLWRTQNSALLSILFAFCIGTHFSQFISNFLKDSTDEYRCYCPKDRSLSDDLVRAICGSKNFYRVHFYWNFLLFAFLSIYIEHPQGSYYTIRLLIEGIS